MKIVKIGTGNFFDLTNPTLVSDFGFCQPAVTYNAMNALRGSNFASEKKIQLDFLILSTYFDG